MKKTNRKAFTIVELVIVIAVIGILAAVLIPTFSGIIKNANIANDQSMATNLTKEIRLASKGDITSEEQLMHIFTNDENGIDKDGKKRVPKALAYDYHFWFDIGTQTVIAATSADIEGREPSLLAAVDEEEDGVVSLSAVTINDVEPASTFSNLRDVFNNGYILIDSEATLDQVFGMSTITKDTYASYITNLKKLMEESKIYDAIAEDVLANFENTIVINDNGVFYNSNNTGNTLIYFADGIKVVYNKHYVYSGSTLNETTDALPTPNDPVINLPSSVVLVQENALNFGSGNSVVINTNCADAKGIADVFSPEATDATIKDRAGNEYLITVGTSPNYPENGANSHILVNKSDSSFAADLITKLPFKDFTISSNEVDEKVEFGSGTLYISSLMDRVELFAKDTASNATSNSIYKWSSNSEFIKINNGILTFDADAILAGGDTAHRATITAYAKNINGVNLEPKTLNVEIRVVESATVKIGDYDYPLGKGDQHLSYYVSAQNHSINPVADIYWKQVEGEPLYDLREGDLVVKDASGTVCADDTVSFGASSSEYSFTVSVDGRLETKFTVAIIDLENSPFQLKFHHSSDYSPYYVGAGDEIKLSDLFHIPNNNDEDTTNDFTFEGATLTIYGFAEGGTELYSVNEINNYKVQNKQHIWTKNYTYTKNIGKDDNWKDVSIKFNTESDYDHTSDIITGNYDVVIEIAPTNDVAMIAHVVILRDAVNVNKNTASTELYKELTNDVVLHDDLTVSSTDKINLKSGADLYGNGYIITATSYKSEATGDTNVPKVKYSFVTTICNEPTCSNYEKSPVKGTCYTGTIFKNWKHAKLEGQSFKIMSTDGTYTAYKTNQALITLDGGTIDNIYINGPVYPTLQYYEDDSTNGANTVSTAYYVSGIKVTTTGKIQNSYVSGFRQPVSAQGTALTVDNTTLEGGNYANLQLVTGSLNLNNVTTVQNPDGMTPTVDSGKDKVIGLGVVIESGALQSTITITGYLNQYNWVPEDTEATLPTIAGINLDTIFGYAFNGIGIPGVIEMKISRFLVHLHEDKSGTQYFNSGFVFANIGDTATINALPNIKTPVETKRNLVGADGNVTGSKTGDADVITGTALGKIVVRLTELTSNSTINGLISNMFGNADGMIYIYSYVDGRVWDYSDDTVDEEASALKDVVVLSDDEDSVHRITYKGYYTDYGN